MVLALTPLMAYGIFLIMPLFIIAILAFFSLGLLLYTLYPFLERILKTWQKRRIDKITPQLNRMFIGLPYRKILLIDIVCPLVTGFLVFLFTRIPWMGLAAAFAGLTLLNFILKQLEMSRRRRFSGQLIDGLMLLSGSLKSGLSLPQALKTLVEEMAPPISQEFGLVMRENRMGVPLGECLMKLKRRMACEELDMIVTAVLVSQETGGELTRVFSNLVLTIRERSRLQSRVRALCIQSKLQGRIMMFLPVIFAIAVFKINPTFFNVLINDTRGRLLLGYAVVSEVIGAILIMRMSRIEL